MLKNNSHLAEGQRNHSDRGTFLWHGDDVGESTSNPFLTWDERKDSRKTRQRDVQASSVLLGLFISVFLLRQYVSPSKLSYLGSSLEICMPRGSLAATCLKGDCSSYSKLQRKLGGEGGWRGRLIFEMWSSTNTQLFLHLHWGGGIFNPWWSQNSLPGCCQWAGWRADVLSSQAPRAGF